MFIFWFHSLGSQDSEPELELNGAFRAGSVWIFSLVLEMLSMF